MNLWQRLKDPTAATNYCNTVERSNNNGSQQYFHKQMGCQYIMAIYTNFPWATLPNDWLIISIIRMIGVQMIYNDFNYETGFPEPTMISNTTSNGFSNQHN